MNSKHFDSINEKTTPSSQQRAKYLVETEWLQQNLDALGIRVFDCAAYPMQNPDETLRRKFPLLPQSGRTQFEEGHIPGAGYIDIAGELSDSLSHLPLMMPSPQQFADVMGKYGIGTDSRVVLYSKANPIWAARVWWMLRASGFDNVRILDGGWAKWCNEDRPVSKDACQYLPDQLEVHPRAGVFVDKEAVLSVVGDEAVRLIHAMPESVYAGSGDIVFGRRGHIPGSVNVPAGSLHDSDSGCYLPVQQLQEIFDQVEVDQVERLITYCGGGVNGANDAFVLTLLGYENVAVYDGSMNEWGNDDSLPIAFTE